MNKTLALFALVAILPFAMANLRSTLEYGSNHDMVLSEEMIATVNNARTTWTAAKNERFSTMTLGQARKMCGTRLEPTRKMESTSRFAAAVSSIPDSFDARDKWASCVHPIRNQGQCGSCWAFGATESFSDRLCIATSGKTNVVLSPEDLVACDTTNMGCQGGYLSAAWSWMASNGVLADSCFPYTSGDGSVPSCPSKCTDSSEPFTRYKVKSSTIEQFSSVEDIQKAIMTDGPVETGFTVYQDFMSYSDGVYKHTTGGMLGGHAVKIVGWGSDNGNDYWIVANSWGTSWGKTGFFWIARGNDECGIESQAIAGTPAN